MSQRFQLNAEMREGTGSSVSRKLRREGIVPAVIYGGEQRSYPVQVEAKAIVDLLGEAASDNVLVDLKVAGAENPDKLVLIQAVQHEVLKGGVTHVDFQAVREDEEIRAMIPVTLKGEPAGVKQGGLLEQLRYDLEVVCLPADLPERLTFEVVALNLGEALHVGEVEFPEGVKATTGDQVVIAMVAETRTAKAEGADGGEEEGGEAPAAEE